MKKLYFSSFTLFVILMLSSSAFPQIPNNGFENWDQGDPVDWWTGDLAGFDAVTQSSDASEGSSAALMTVIDNGGGLGYIPFQSAGDNGLGIPVSQRYGSFGGYYKFSAFQGETFNVDIFMYLGLEPIGTGDMRTPTQSPTSYIEFNVPINYFTGDTPDLAIINIYVADLSGGPSIIGTWALVDDVTFGVASDVEQISGLPENFSLRQNYPNPFNPSTLIEYSIPEQSFVDLKVYDILGNEIAVLVNAEQSAGTYRADFTADNLASGLYVAQLRAGSFSKTIKMNLIK